jgi:hypothetical protein
MIAKQGISRVVVVVVIGDTILGLSTLIAKPTVSPSRIRHANFICHD